MQPSSALIPSTGVWLLLVLSLAATTAAQSPSEDVYTDFQQNCASCHTIGGGRLAGPDLEGVGERRERDWLVRFVRDPKAVIDSGDAVAQQLLSEARGVVMPTAPGMDAARVGRLLDLIAYESELAAGGQRSRFGGLQIADRPLTPADVTRGRALFEGRAAFASGAPACLACHDVAGLGGLGGGRLGPDLTTAYARLDGRKALAAWLSNPPSAVMAPVYRAAPLEGEEVLGLVAFLADAGAGGEVAAASSTLDFLLWGLGLAAALLVLFDFAWRDRFRAMRRPLVDAARRRTARGSAGPMETASR